MKYRKIRVIGESEKKGKILYFHTWAGLSEHPLAVAEDYMGMIHLLNHTDFEFIDTCEDIGGA